MTSTKLRIAILASTSGSVMNALLANPFFRSQIALVVSDRACGALERAHQWSIPTATLKTSSTSEFCDSLNVKLQAEQIDYVFSFYTKLLIGAVLMSYEDRIINMHPSILPSFKGLSSYDDAIRYGTRYLGSTIHLIDDRMDEGKIVMQTAFPYDPTADPVRVRHHLFLQQCRSLLQVTRWLYEGRLRVNGNRVVLEGASFGDFEYSPSLDFVEARAFDVAPAGACEQGA